MAHGSRRAFLAGSTALSSIVTSAPPAVAAGAHQAEAAFLQWLEIVGERNAGRNVPPGESAEDEDAVWDYINAVEAKIVDAPDSPTKAAALALNILCYLLDSHMGRSIPESMGHGSDDETRLALQVVRCLQPVASERIARLIADLFADPSRTAIETALFRAYSGDGV